MPEHGSRIVEIGGREDKRHRIRVHLGQPVVELGAGVFRKDFAIDAEFLLQPLIAGNKFALGVFGLRLLIGRREKAGQGSVEFGPGIEFAGRAQEKRGIVNLALDAFAHKARPVVQQYLPLTMCPEPFGLGRLLEFNQVGWVTGCRRDRKRRVRTRPHHV